MFIVFEGVEGSGKSTQARMLADALRARGLSVVLTREPGGTALGDAIREILLRGPAEMSPLCELFLFCAARAEHVRHVIAPALAQGQVVISDRYEISSVVYQGYAGDVGVPLAERLNAIATEGLHADLTIILDLDPEIGLARNAHPAKSNRIEGKSLDFHRRVREGYLAWAASHPRESLVVDATKQPEEIHREVLARLGLL
ncbi:MAG: dTMP kinase [Armatimonadetes bacterium]|nr:dTMP kinase [Armatimonadota bacterium]